MPVAVLTDVTDLDPAPGIAILRDAGFEVTVLADADGLADAARHADALLVGYARISEQMLRSSPHLGVVSLLSAGTDNIDIAAAERLGIWVSNLPSLATDEVAEHAWTLALALLRQLPFYTRTATDPGIWWTRPDRLPPRASTLTLGVAGLGRIGRRVAELARPAVARVVGCDPYLDPQNWPAGIDVAATLTDLIQVSDIVSLHLPLTAETAGIINKDLLAHSREGLLLVNTARGALVDTEALAEALRVGAVAGAGLDVLDTEPPPLEHPSLGHPRVLLTPHVGYLSQHTASDYVTAQARNVTAWWHRGRPLHPVNTRHIPARTGGFRDQDPDDLR